jgi:hypothetical protein
MVRLDAIARRDKKKHQYRRLFKALTANPEKHERLWYCGIAQGDEKVLTETAEGIIQDLKKRGLIARSGGWPTSHRKYLRVPHFSPVLVEVGC